MTGVLLPPAGDPCPPVIPAPLAAIGEDITTNSAVCAAFRYPPHQRHIPCLLPGQEPEVRHLKTSAFHSMHHLCDAQNH